MGAKATDTRTHSKAHGASIDFSTAVILCFWFGSSQEMKCELHILSQKPSSQCIGVTVDLQARRNSRRFCRCGVWCAWFSSTSWPEVRRWMLSVTAKHCRNCDGPFRTSGAGCLVPVLLHDSARPLTARPSTHLLQEFRWDVFNHPPYIPDLAPRISISFYTSRNSCTVSPSVFRMKERRRWVSYDGSNSRRPTSTIQGYKSWSNSMTEVSVPEVWMLKDSSTLSVCVPVNLSIKWVLFQ